MRDTRDVKPSIMKEARVRGSGWMEENGEERSIRGRRVVLAVSVTRGIFEAQELWENAVGEDGADGLDKQCRFSITC